MQPTTSGNKRVRATLWAIAMLTGLAVSGCATAPKPMYAWNGYEDQMYEYLKGSGGDPAAQVAALEAGLERMKASAAMPPPGYHAHLGLLYTALGKDEQAAEQLQTEKSLFPESTRYVDFLLAKAKK